MTTELTSHDAQPSRSAILIVALSVMSLVVGTFAYGWSVVKATEQANATAMANENQTFCIGLGFGAETESYRKCGAGLDEVRLHHEQRLALETAGLL
jgi:hypothetical protein